MNNYRFMLMNANNKLADIRIVNNEIIVENLYLENLNSVKDIQSYLKIRLSHVNRNGVHTLIKLNNLDSTEKFLSLTRAISCIDTLWVNDLYNYTTWDKINPYTNRLSQAIAEIAINGESTVGYSNIRRASPQYTLDGSVDKCIKTTEDGLYLYKTSGERWSDLAGCRPYCEYYASIVAEQLGLDNSVMYRIDLTKTHDKLIKPYVYCKLFTTEEYGLTQMRYSKYNGYTSNELVTVLDIVSRQRYKDMIVFDSLIMNPDRHTGNYGFIISNKSGHILSLAPIYDNDCSLGALTSVQDKSFEQAFNEIKYSKLPKTDIGSYDDHARWAMTKDMYIRLRDVDRIKLGQRLPGISQKRFDFMEYLVNRRRVEILNMFS